MITPIENDKNYQFSLTISCKKNDDEILTVCKTKKFSLCNKDKPKIENHFNIRIFFSICDDGKLFFFYKSYSNDSTSLYNIHIVTICIETMVIVSNQKVCNSFRYGTGGAMTRKERIEKIGHVIFQKLFFLKKRRRFLLKYAIIMR